MTALTVRRLLVDLETPLPAQWCGGDAFRTALFNALSMSFPAGEQIFIDAVRKGQAALPEADRARFAAEVQGFIGQEATHRRIHERFNAHLATAGLVNHWQPRILKRRERLLEPRPAVVWLSVTAATEHWTAILAQVLLTQPGLLAGAEPRLRDLWHWHASEELEHRSTAFDLYRALNGREKWRKRAFLIVSHHFVFDLARQTLHNLRREGQLWRWSTWVSGWHTLFSRGGVVREGFGPWRNYLRADFHPLQADGGAGAQWLQAHADLAPPVKVPG